MSMKHVKESSTLLAAKKGTEAGHVRSPAKGTKTSTSLFPLITASPRDLIARQNTKRLLLWFQTWHAWQQRTFICRMMEHCSRQHLELLATALEPILHLDFSSSLVPHLASLHLDGSATFQVQRSVLQNVIRPEILGAEDSLAYLSSIPTTLLTDSKDNSQQFAATDCPRMNPCAQGVRSGRESILPAIPLTHVKHVPPFSLSHQSLEDIVALRRERFGSVPDFKSTTNLLKNVRHKERLRPRQVGHRRSKSVGACPSVKLERSRGGMRVAEHFKGQLGMVSNWMAQWQGPQKASLLLEVVKLCDKDLLGYFVQCLYQKLRECMTIDTQPDVILLHIFSYLDSQSLCRASQVCRRWQHLCSSPHLWKALCARLGAREGVGDLVWAVEVGQAGEEGEGERAIDWKQAYKTLFKMILKIKVLVVKAAAAAVEREEDEQQKVAGLRMTSCAGLSLREMIALVRARTPASVSTVTTQDVIRSAPESAAGRRQRLREERRASRVQREEAERKRLESSKSPPRRPHDSRWRAGSGGQPAIVSVADEALLESRRIRGGENMHDRGKSKGSPVLVLVEVAVDRRPAVPYLPNSDGIQWLSLAGCLQDNQALKPGRPQPIPRLCRFKPFDSTVLCLQCDQRKLVMGMAGREINVHDIRTGRLVCRLEGHKGSVQCLQFDDHKIVSGSWDTTCIVWDVVHFNAVKTLYGHADCVSCLQFDADRLVTGSYDKSLRIWSALTWDCITVIGGAHKDIITCLRFNDSIIASGSHDKTVKLWSLAGRCVATLAHEAALTALQLSHLLLISASSGGTLHLWSLHSNSALMQWKVDAKAWLHSLAVTGSRIFGGGSDSVIHEWDITTGMCTRALTGHSRALTCVWAGHQKLVSAAEDHTVCVWHSKSSAMKDEETHDSDLDLDLTDIPIRVITQHA